MLLISDVSTVIIYSCLPYFSSESCNYSPYPFSRGLSYMKTVEHIYSVKLVSYFTTRDLYYIVKFG